MKTFVELSEEDKKLAVNYFHTHVLIQMAQRVIVFKDELNETNWQETIDKIIEENKTKHPLFIAEKLGDNIEITQLAYILAGGNAGASLYVEDNENAVNLRDIRDMGQHEHSEKCSHKVVH